MPNVLVGRVARRPGILMAMANVSTNENEPLEGVDRNILFRPVALVKPVVLIGESGESA